MIDRHIHRFTTFERQKKGLAGLFGRTELVLICECGITTEEYAEQTARELQAIEARLRNWPAEGFDHGDGEICEDDHPA